MRTLIIICIGLALAALTLWFTPAAKRLLFGAVFTVGWLLATLWNLNTGLSHGYTLAEELPIHLMLFGVPVAAYWLYVWFKQNS
ncbi:hypothetical protein [Thiofilum flexile]|uniref:hypothetical protein n=1 Tax=Thiofilum flexile TaxID=125627 RepID=UPI0003665411|nr:hypothetical protein [Thiofilum flexile]